MAERKATNKYYPPDWDPSKGSINTYVGQHPLRARARKLDQGILVVRFEMPWNAWCLHCNVHIGQGIRYNAEKKLIDHYYTTPIFQFRMKCRSCSGWMEIHNNPKETDFDCINGVKRKAEDFVLSEDDFDEDGDPILHTLTAEERERITANPFMRFENNEAQLKRSEKQKTRLTSLFEHNEQRWSDPYLMSRRLRNKFRTEKKELQTAKEEVQSFTKLHSLTIPILPPSTDDADEAASINFASNELQHPSRARMKSKGIFGSKKAQKPVPVAVARSLRQAHRSNEAMNPLSKNHNLEKKIAIKKNAVNGVVDYPPSD